MSRLGAPLRRARAAAAAAGRGGGDGGAAAAAEPLDGSRGGSDGCRSVFSTVASGAVSGAVAERHASPRPRGPSFRNRRMPSSQPMSCTNRPLSCVCTSWMNLYRLCSWRAHKSINACTVWFGSALKSWRCAASTTRMVSSMKAAQSRMLLYTLADL